MAEQKPQDMPETEDPAADVDLDFDFTEQGDQQDEIERLTTERDDMRDRFMRALADAENARKRGAVSYTHLTLPTIRRVLVSVGAA